MSPEIVAGLVGAAATAVLAILNSYLTSRAQVAEEVRKARLDAYPKLWRLTSLVSVWPRSDPRLEDLQGCSATCAAGTSMSAVASTCPRTPVTATVNFRHSWRR